MKILIIEDNELKLARIKDFLQRHNFQDFEEASSFNTGVRKSLTNSYQFMIIDMSIPTFDKTENDPGGRFRVFGGQEVIEKLSRKTRLVPFAVLTGYEDFNNNDGHRVNFKQLEKLLSQQGDFFGGLIYYDVTSLSWENELLKVMMKHAE